MPASGIESLYSVDAAATADETTSLLECRSLKHPFPDQDQVQDHTNKTPLQWRALSAFIIALLCCGCANSLALFSMLAPGFQYSLGFSLFQINSIGIASSLGMYLPMPLLGIMADKMGPGNLGIMSILLFTPAYLTASYITSLPSDQALAYYNILAACFAAIGAATASLYFSSVVTCAKMMPKAPGLAISAPVAFFGLSSLWQSQLLQKCFFNDKGYLMLPATFKFFAFLYLFAGLAAYFGSTVVGQLGSSAQESVIAPAQDADQKLALIDHVEDTEYGTLATSQDDLVYKRHENVAQFLQDKTVWFMFGAFVLTSGPLEMFLNNMGMIIGSIVNGPVIAANVSIFSAFSTLARLSMGIVSDLLAEKVSRPVILVTMITFAALLHFLMATGLFTLFQDGKFFFLMSSGIGFAYGAIYTLTPTIVACTWGVENLGTHWGIFITAPALGSTTFGSVFAKVYERNSEQVGDGVSVCTGLACYETTFLITGTAFAVSALVVLGIYLCAWKPSGRR